jgi:chromate transporter
MTGVGQNPSGPAAGRGRLREVASVFLRLGFTSFGGPVAHLGYFRRELVERRRWMDDASYGDLVALCQLLPGPTSSQVVFGLGMSRSGLAGALLASACFMLPSALLMIAFGYGISAMGDPSGAGWLRGLRLAAVAAVARAVWGMAGTLCPDWPRRMLGLAAAAALLLFPGSLVQVIVILVAGGVGWRALGPGPEIQHSPAHFGSRGPARVFLALFAALLLALPLIARVSGSRQISIWDSFYRSGALVVGGGHVVLPLLRSEFVPKGWVSDNTFLGGYGLAQALPGPLFTFAGFLGTVMDRGRHAWIGGVSAIVALFLPGWLLVAGWLGHWDALRQKRWFGSAACGANAAVVGILLAALIRPLMTESIAAPSDLLLAAAGVALLCVPRMPTWAVVGLIAAAGQWIAR